MAVRAPIGSQLFQQEQHMPVVVRITANFDRCNWKCKPSHFSEIFGNFYKLAVHKKRRSISSTCEIPGERRTDVIGYGTLEVSED